jgi:hypothetical protein
MNQFLKKSLIYFVLACCLTSYSQNDVFEKKRKKKFEPKFTLGSGLYTLTGDIQNNQNGFLKGVAGYSAGMKFDIYKNLDLSFLLLKTSFSANNEVESFTSEVSGVGLNLGYNIPWFFKMSKVRPIASLGLQQLGFTSYINDLRQDRATMLAITKSIGIRMNITDKLQFDIAVNSATGLGDLDMSKEQGNDNYKSLNFTVHYDLFSKSKSSVDDYYSDDNYYNDVDFTKLESEDEDGDLVLDMDDYCPETPIGVKVDDKGCPVDDDKDGIANYLDKQKNTPAGSIVDAKGIRLTADKYYSIYSNIDIASRNYANFYNELEIKREDYKTVDEYLIARANAFNRAYNEGLNNDLNVSGIIYKVKIAEYKDGMPAKVTNKLLSLDDLKSFTMLDDAVIYAVGTYNSLAEAMARQIILEQDGFLETNILVNNNGDVSDYIAYVPEPKLDVDEKVLLIDSLSSGTLLIDSVKLKKTDFLEKGNIYRIQIGAFKQPLSDAIFTEVNDVISFTDRNGLYIYMAGSFTAYNDAVNYQNGKRVGLNVSVKDNVSDINLSQISNLDSNRVEFIVQILVSKKIVSKKEIEKMSKLGDIDKEAEGVDIFRYYAGTYSTLEDANIRLTEAKIAGYIDAFIFAKLNGERISLDEVKKMLKY